MAVKKHTERLPRELFVIDHNGRVDMVDGVEVSDAVDALWGALRTAVQEAWETGPLGHERARTRLLVTYLDKVRPSWRSELAWED